MRPLELSISVAEAIPACGCDVLRGRNILVQVSGGGVVEDGAVGAEVFHNIVHSITYPNLGEGIVHLIAPSSA